MENITTTLQNLIVTYGLNLVWAIVILIIGYWTAGFIAKLARKGLERVKIDKTIVRFARNLVYYAVLIFVILAALNQLGVQTTSLIAVLGAAGLAIGLALQGALSNFAAGVIILLFRPFKIGDFVEIADAAGTVEDIQIFNTVLVTRDNKTVTIPNGQVTSGNIVNYSKKGILRVDLVYGIGYGDDILKAKKILEEIVTANEKVLKDPPPLIAVHDLADSSVNFAVRPYVKVQDYWGIHFSLTEAVKLRFDEEGISIPFPQRDVHLFQEG